MRWYNKSILNRILTIIVVSNLLIAIVAGIYFNRSLSSQDEYEHLISDEIVLALQAQDILSDFKTQVQEWKNVLIRGADDAQRDKYWQRFQKTESSIQQQLDQLIPRIADQEARALMDRFRAAPSTDGRSVPDGIPGFRGLGVRSYRGR